MAEGIMPKSNKGAIVGIFTTWNFNLFDKAENVFRKKLSKNPTYPFELIKPNVYILAVKSGRFVLGLVMTALTIGVTAGVYLGEMSVNEFVIYPILIACGFLSVAYFNKNERTFILDLNTHEYEFYKGRHLIYRGDFHNIYIRLRGQKSGGSDTYYTLVVNGYQVLEHPITSSSTSHDRLYKLGRRLAQRLEVNFFDYQDLSRYHVIKHRCPYEDKNKIMS